MRLEFCCLHELEVSNPPGTVYAAASRIWAEANLKASYDTPQLPRTDGISCGRCAGRAHSAAFAQRKGELCK